MRKPEDARYVYAVRLRFILLFSISLPYIKLAPHMVFKADLGTI